MATAIALAGCGPAEERQEAAEMMLPVEVLTVQTESLVLSPELPGRIGPVRVAEVRARVADIVMQKRFEEGADAKAGDLLFQIDPTPLKTAVSRTEGELARNRTVLFETQARVRRCESLVKIQAISQQDFDTTTADLRSAETATRSAQADLETVRLDLGYTSVTAPISGRIGRALVIEDALVGQNEATLMARIQQLDPIYTDFTQTATKALRLHDTLKKDTLAAGDNQALTLHVEGTPYGRRDTLQFADVAVDRDTGQVALRGKSANPDGVLLPGMYVRVRTLQGIDNQAILVPQRTMHRSSDGSTQVVVVGADRRAEARSVGTGVMQGPHWQITKGLEPGDRVMVGGLATVQPGMKIVPKPDGVQTQAQSSVPQQ